MDIFDWVQIISSDSWLGFSLQTSRELVTDPYIILEKRHMFAELFWMKTLSDFSSLMQETQPIIPKELSKDDSYIQYWDVNKKVVTAVNQKSFEKMILS